MHRLSYYLCQYYIFKAIKSYTPTYVIISLSQIFYFLSFFLFHVCLFLSRSYLFLRVVDTSFLNYFKQILSERERNVLFNDALNTFYLRLYGVRHMVKDHSDSEKGNPLPPHRLLLSINSKGSFICTIPQTG